MAMKLPDRGGCGDPEVFGRQPNEIGRTGRVRLLTRGWLATALVVLLVTIFLTRDRSAQSQENVRSLKTNSAPIRSLRVSPVAPMLAACDTGGRLMLWEYPEELPRELFGGPDEKITCVAFAPDRELMAWGNEDGRIVLRDLTTGNRTQTQTLEQGNEPISVLEFSPNGKTLASGDMLGRIELWDLTSERLVYDEATRYRVITALDFSSDGRYLTAGGVDDLGGAILVREVESGTPRPRLRLASNSNIRALEFLPGDDQVLWMDLGQQRLGRWDLIGGESELLLDDQHRVTSFALSPDGTMLAVGTSNGAVELWDWDSFQVIDQLKDQPNPIQSLGFSFDGKLVAVGGAVTGVLLWQP